ncbi:ubiquitin-conjugating enzyme/RWD-like protein [Polychytrium aggregatum]|uniref:ubiquitin-conjugating enzyme/RWD-like protein n=1 Tax=Polychytrium aggregatum TaxID=110093 RepID=UPI0022FDC856|nr:ubiquitin-conjugating enzyme/RWD-like protein [Polychytrium aggregatum]KAI9205704.1 ubiquitin-conjugating enzyme/RWD-like protein [Polychytrium aggregatum]
MSIPEVPKPTSAHELEFYSNHFRKYELLIEYKNLREPEHCPTGVYVMPSIDNIYEWYGVIFIHRGYYKEGVFKFFIEIPEQYPYAPPRVEFITSLFHPLVSKDGRFSLDQQFATWRPRIDNICHILHYIKNSFKDAVLQNLQEEYCLNKEAYRTYVRDRHAFVKLAAQVAQASSSEKSVYERIEGSTLNFSYMTDDEAETLRLKLITNQGAVSLPSASPAGGQSVFDKITTNINYFFTGHPENGHGGL